jgi:TPR repeat protein
VRYFRKWADLGDCTDVLEFANRLAAGDLVAKNETEAAGYYRQAGELGCKHGFLAYSKALQEGKGVPKNVTEAAKYAELAA